MKSLLLTVGLALAAALLAAAVWHGDSGWMYDAKVYRLGAHLATTGADLYPAVARHPFTYPPFAALLFVALLMPPEAVMAIVWTAVNLLCLGLAAWLGLGWAGVREPRRRYLTAAATAVVAAGLDPVTATLVMGQINLVLMVLVLADLLLPDGNRYKGLLLGLAVGIKLEPALFAVYLMLTRRFAAAARATAAFAATVVVAFAVLPKASIEYWSGTFLNSHRVGDAVNPRTQSLRSVTDRWLHTASDPTAIVLGLDAAAAAATLALAVWAHRRGDELLAICATATGMLLVSPITWQHHWVWVVPMLIWLGRQAFTRGSRPAAAVGLLLAADFASRVYLYIPVDVTVDTRLDLPALLASTAYPAGVVLFCAAAAWLAGQQSSQTSTPSSASGGLPRITLR